MLHLPSDNFIPMDQALKAIASSRYYPSIFLILNSFTSDAGCSWTSPSMEIIFSLGETRKENLSLKVLKSYDLVNLVFLGKRISINLDEAQYRHLLGESPVLHWREFAGYLLSKARNEEISQRNIDELQCDCPL